MDITEHYQEKLDTYGYVPINHDEPNFFPVELLPVFDGEAAAIPGVKRLVRTDTNETLKVHGDSYGLVSYQDSFGAFDAALNASGLNTDGMLINTDMSHNGARCFRQYVLPEHRIEMPDGEPLALRLIMFNSYDGSTKFRGRAGGYRFVCANTMCLGTDIINVSVKHTKNAALEIPNAIENIVASADRFMEWGPRFELWNRVQLTPASAYQLLQKFTFSQPHLDRMFAIWSLAKTNTLLELYHAMTFWSTFSSSGDNRAASQAAREASVATLIESATFNGYTAGDPILA